MADDKKSLLDLLGSMYDTWEQATLDYEAENDSWWNSLSEKEREDAFYAVVKRIHKGDIVDKGSYRYVLYQIFGFGPGMYAMGMDCGYMDLHNAIMSDDEQRILQDHYRNKQALTSKEA